MDQDRSGSIDFDEFLNLVANHTHEEDSEEQRVDDLCEAFRVFDDDGSGTIPTDNLKYALTCLGDKLNEEEIQELLKFAEIQKDGTLSYKPFVESIEVKKKKKRKRTLKLNQVKNHLVNEQNF